jgi:biotin transporter BioY
MPRRNQRLDKSDVRNLGITCAAGGCFLMLACANVLELLTTWKWLFLLDALAFLLVTVACVIFCLVIFTNPPPRLLDDDED